MSEEIMIKEFWHNNELPTQYVLLSDYVQIQQKLAEMEKRARFAEDIIYSNDPRSADKFRPAFRVLELEQKLSEALEVIRFYGDRERWNISEPHGANHVIHESDVFCSWGGERARTFLKKIES